MRRRLFFAVCTIFMVAMVATPVGATPPADVQFEVPTVIPGGGMPTSGPFTASGPAVDLGLMCEYGQTIDVFGFASGVQSQTGVNFHVVKLFTCDDGSGEFLVKLEARIDARGDNFRWVILDGTGDYESLHGTGSGFGYPLEGGVLDIYDGRLHVD